MTVYVVKDILLKNSIFVLIYLSFYWKFNEMIRLDENGHIHMQDPMHFFHMDQKFAYNGEVRAH